MERLGETIEWGELLIRLLELKGWKVHRRRAFAGDGVILIATNPAGYDVQAAGATVAEASFPLFMECVTRIPGGDEEQLVLPV
jgi:hypothetical protein